MQEQKTYNLYELQIAGLLFANPSIPASVAFHLIFKGPPERSKTVPLVSHSPVFERTVTHGGNTCSGNTKHWAPLASGLQEHALIRPESPSHSLEIPLQTNQKPLTWSNKLNSATS